MELSKKQIAQSLVKFLEEYLNQTSMDKQTKLILYMAKDSIKNDINVLDSFLDNPLIKTVIMQDDDMYDVTPFITSMRNIISEYGMYSLFIPKVPLLTTEEKCVKLSSSDMDILIKMINEVRNPSATVTEEEA